MRGLTMAIAAFATLSPALAAAPRTAAVVLAGDGLAVGGKTLRFAVATRGQAIAMVGAALGKPIKQGSHGDCATGSILTYASFRGDFELSFVKGRLAGWTADGATPKTAKGIGVGATLVALRKAYPDVSIDPGDEANGGLGPSFQRENGPNGWLDGTGASAKVVGLFAGATCIVG